MQSDIGRYRRWSITVALIGSIGSLLVIAQAVSWYLSYNIAFSNAYNLLADKSALITDAIELEVRKHMDPARLLVEHLAEEAETGRLDTDDHEQLQSYLAGALAATPQLNTIIFLRDDLQALQLIRVQPEMGLQTANWTHRYDSRSGMDQLARVKQPLWGGLVYVPEIATSVINVRAPVVVDGQLIGAFIAAVSIDTLSGYLADLQLKYSEPDGGEFRRADAVVPFILYRHDEVLAHGSLLAGNPLVNSRTPLPRIEDFADPVLRRIWDNSLTENIDDIVIPAPYSAHLVVDESGAEWVFFHQRINDYGDVPWIIGSYFSLRALDGDLYPLWRAAFLFSPALFLIALGVFLFIGSRISRPVHRIASAAEAIRHTPIAEVKPLVRSRLKEFDLASRTLNNMIEGLQEREHMRQIFGRYVPESVAGDILKDEGFLRPQSRIATIMFTDIVGFSALSEDMPPEQLIDLLNQYFAVLIDPIERNGGVIHQFQGDAVLATYNLPVKDDRHADHALAAALEIQGKLDIVEFVGNIRLKTRIGINTGYAVCGTVGAGDRLGFTVHGDDVNLAARIEQLNKTYGTGILLSEATKDLIEGDYRFRFVDRVKVRGRKKEVSVYTV